MEIAKEIDNTEYLKLNLDNRHENDWQTAFGYLEKRLTERYIEPADVLIKYEEKIDPKDRKFGFTIVAIDCMLIETLQSFYDGYTDTKNKSKKMFRVFLTKRNSFKSHFNVSTAELFFDHFRCGILHQTETKGDSKVWSVGPLINENDNSIVVNRNLFHRYMEKELTIYINLMKNSSASSTERQHFKTKMDFICRK